MAPRKQRSDLRKALFVALYFEERDLTLAAIARKAGYSPNGNEATARNTADRLLNDPWVKEQIAERKRRLLRRADYGAEKVLTALIDIAQGRMSDFAELLGSDDPESALRCLDPDLAGLIEAIQVQRNADGKVTKVSIKLYSRLDALKLLGIHWGLRFQGSRIVIGGDGADPSAKGQARLQLADLLSEMDSASLVQFRDMIERLKQAEQLRLTQTVDGEAEEVADDAEEVESDDGATAAAGTSP